MHDVSDGEELEAQRGGALECGERMAVLQGGAGETHR